MGREAQVLPDESRHHHAMSEERRGTRARKPVRCLLRKDLRAKALDAANKPPVVPGPPKIESSSGSFSHTMKVEPSFAPEESAQVVTGFGGKPAPAPAPQPLL